MIALELLAGLLTVGFFAFTVGLAAGIWHAGRMYQDRVKRFEWIDRAHQEEAEWHVTETDRRRSACSPPPQARGIGP